MIYLQLFISFFKIGLFGFGGGYAILSLIEHEVEYYGWMNQQEFVDIVAISQVTPGPIGINAATYIGYTASGHIIGSIIATSAIILPSLIIMLTLCKLYLRLEDKYANNPYYNNTLLMLRFTVLGLIAAAALTLITPFNFIDYYSWIFFAGVFILSLLKVKYLSNPILLIIIAGAIGYFVYS